MRSHFLVFALLCAVASGEELDTKILRLIGDSVVAACGVDLERYNDSPLARFFPAQLPSAPSSFKTRRLIFVDYGSSRLTIYQGAGSPAGIPGIVALDGQTAIAGDPAAVAAAMERWGGSDDPGERPAKIGDLSKSYDEWFFALPPLLATQATAGAGSKYQAELASAIQEVKGGLRTGGLNEFYLEATTERFEDTQTLAGLARWLPGMIQGQNGVDGRLVDAIEDLDARAAGSQASLSFVISDQKLREIIDEDARGGAPAEQ